MDIRIDKMLAAATGLSRKEARALIKAGLVGMKGETVKDIGAKVSGGVTLRGLPLEYSDKVYYMLNKPKGILSAGRDKNRETVVDIIANETGRKGLFPVGRLDKDTTGLLLITNDGDFSHKVISPKSGIVKEYIVTLDGAVTSEVIEGFEKGVTLADGTVCLSAKLEILSENTCKCSIMEGKYHQIKRMFGVYALGVNELERVKIGRLCLDEKLKSGEYKELSSDQIKRIFE